VPHVLREYALLADGERGILVGPRGDYVWMCFPGWDDDAVFSALIGGRGSFTVAPVERNVWGGWYEPRSLIWRSRWTTDQGAVIECREALALPAASERAVILRRVLAQAGTARVAVELAPRGRFGKTPLTSLKPDDDGSWHGRLGDVHLCVAGAEAAEPVADGHGGHALTLQLEIEHGGHHDLVLVLDREQSTPPDPAASWKATEAAWRDRVPVFDGAVAQRDAQHAYAVLSGLTSLGGGMVAAATTSLPERFRKGRNYDYRYVWIRDQAFTGHAIAAAGPYPLLDDAVSFVRDRLLEDGANLAPAYTIRGDRIPAERHLDLPGYPGGSDVVGNHVSSQFQLDVFGEALLLFAAAGRHDRLDAEAWRAVALAAEAIESRWREPDAGIWELDPDEWTHSRLICVAGLHAAARLDGAGKDGPRWLALADAIAAETAGRALHPSGRWQRSPSDDRVDVALLLPAIRGATAMRDPRSLATLRAVEEELTSDGYVYRFRHDSRPLEDAEGAFLLCGFILALAHGRLGRHVEAARWFERNRTACGPPGLLSEEYDVRQRQMRGNLPQAFVHALLFECAVEEDQVEAHEPDGLSRRRPGCRSGP
jgi:GH15 family glucan-1,4-alpha-glucosidase